MRDTDAAWLAGIFDGEGYVTLKCKSRIQPRKTTSWSLFAQIGNTHQGTIERVWTLTGLGSVTARKLRSGRIAYEWRVWATQAVDFLQTIQPYTTTKREQIAVALEADHFRRNAKRESCRPRPGTRHSAATHRAMHGYGAHLLELRHP